MSTAHVLFESVAPVWMLWALAGAALLVLARRAKGQERVVSAILKVDSTTP